MWGYQRLPMEKDRLTRWRHFPTVASIVISVIGLGITGLVNFTPFGSVKPRVPQSYAIIRGLGYDPSDHLVLPLVWESTNARPTIIRDLKLVITYTNPDGTLREIEYPLWGAYPNLSPKTGQDDSFLYKDAILVSPNATTQQYLVFHIANWWDIRSPNRKFRFEVKRKSASERDCSMPDPFVVVMYREGSSQKYETGPKFILPLFSSVNDIADNQLAYFGIVPNCSS